MIYCIKVNDEGELYTKKHKMREIMLKQVKNINRPVTSIVGVRIGKLTSGCSSPN